MLTIVTFTNLLLHARLLLLFNKLYCIVDLVCNVNLAPENRPIQFNLRDHNEWNRIRGLPPVARLQTPSENQARGLQCVNDNLFIIMQESQPSHRLCGSAHHVNPLESRGNYSATSNNTKLVHWPLIGGLLHLVQRERDWTGGRPGPSSLYS